MRSGNSGLAYLLETNWSSSHCMLKGECCNVVRWCCRPPPCDSARIRKMELCPNAGADVAGDSPIRCATPKPAAPGKDTIAARQLPPENHASVAAQSTGRQTNAKPRLSMGEGLPSDVMDVIVGFMDRKTLCTARLVSKTFCTAASPHICRLTLRGTSQAMSCQRFPRLDSVSVYHSGEEVDPHLRQLITALTIRDCQDLPMGETLSQLALMPKLHTLNLWWHSGGEFGMEGAAALGCHCSNQEWILVFDDTGREVGRIPGMARAAPSSTDISWLQQTTALRNLQALSIVDAPLSLPLIGDLTGLTGLTWSCHPFKYRSMPVASGSIVAPLASLTKLRSLRLGCPLSEADVEIACSLGSGSLHNLELEASSFNLDASPDCGRFLTRQTALTRLGVDGQLCNMRYVGALRVELLHSLKLQRLTSVDAEGLAALRKATSLTELHIRFGWMDEGTLPDLPLSQTLAGLTRLRSFMLGRGGRLALLRGPVKLLDYDLALRPLTGLTELAICGGGLDDGDLRALCVLTRLRVLDLCRSSLTDGVVPELAVLTNLEKLRLVKCGVTGLAPVTEVLNPLRHARGWPMIARTQ